MNFERIFQNCIGNFCIIFILQLPELSQFAVGLLHIQLFIRRRAWLLMFFREASKFRKWGIAHLLTNLKSRNSTLNWQIYELIRLIEHIFDSQQWCTGRENGKSSSLKCLGKTQYFYILSETRMLRNDYFMFFFLRQ